VWSRAIFENGLVRSYGWLSARLGLRNALGRFGVRPGIAVPRFQLLPHKGKADVPIDEPQQVSLWNLIFQVEVIEQRLGAVVLLHHDQQASSDENPTQYGRDQFLLTCFC